MKERLKRRLSEDVSEDQRWGPNRTVEAATEGALRFGLHRL